MAFRREDSTPGPTEIAILRRRFFVRAPDVLDVYRRLPASMCREGLQGQHHDRQAHLVAGTPAGEHRFLSVERVVLTGQRNLGARHDARVGLVEIELLPVEVPVFETGRTRRRELEGLAHPTT